MFQSLFRKKIPHLPVTTAELSAALRTAAQFADGDSAKLEYSAAADALDRAITHTRKHADAPTRDAVAYALGRAELNLQDQLRELIEVSKDTHLLVQGVHAVQSEQGAAAVALRADFQAFAESLTQWREELEAWRGQVDATLASFTQSRDESKAERAEIQEAIRAMDSRHGGQIAALLDRMGVSEADRGTLHQQIDAIAAQLAAIEELLEVSGGHEAGG